MERRWGSDLTVSVAPPTVAWSRAVVAALVEQRLSLVPEVQHGVESRRARAPHANLPSVRELRIGLRVLVVTSYQRVVVQMHSRPVLPSCRGGPC